MLEAMHDVNKTGYGLPATGYGQSIDAIAFDCKVEAVRSTTEVISEANRRCRLVLAVASSLLPVAVVATRRAAPLLAARQPLTLRRALGWS
jgi:hypothetical protein